ncbi:MAG: pyridoxine 5'-phosphate synthase [Magnetococcales bacterium]|nr:pyridoxine 5'-phosphate synthase [Magnetococcales bacterium]
MIKLGVNVDHVATVRQARGSRYPDPVVLAVLAEQGGADGITVHLREDRRHIQERDVRVLLETVTTKVNLEMAVTPAMVDFAIAQRPADCCLVPEKRAELTTEGGLDAVGLRERLAEVVPRLTAAGIQVSLFIDPELPQIEVAAAVGAPVVELHTGRYASADHPAARTDELLKITRAADHARSLGVTVNAGHGLHYRNVAPIAAIAGMQELNIGHAIVARALEVGMVQAVAEMVQRMRAARSGTAG